MLQIGSPGAHWTSTPIRVSSLCVRTGIIPGTRTQVFGHSRWAQKRAFHRQLDREIWGKWSWHFRLYTRGDVPFAHRFANRALVVNFDIRWMLHGGQWEVGVVRVAPGTPMNNNTRSNVSFATRHIQLFSVLFQAYTAQNSAGISRPGFRAGPHEFGHTLDYPDDYTPTSPFLSDADSLMNIGQQLRQRHIALVRNTLNTMIYGVTFEF